ncbi:hypothetical protein LTR09_000753 [Extremus antarcticus]|uniref:Uncharacterized protein n=1 Tax=Extremus antarcticus TaxID=702011 RepID=A0AAJ0LXL5_9PEZI|nr:hypothetical protein LTR09_000753 [Extremus antarcticus]
MLSATLDRRQNADNTATVDLAVKRGSPQDYASGFIYGIPDTPDHIPDHFYENMGFNYARVGGAQIPAGGWITGPDGYAGRINSTKSNYDTARKYGATVILLPHDLWGTDHANDSTVWPGDDGDWSDYDDFLDQVMDDLVRYDMLEGMVFDIWNEPDISFFWVRSQQQWVDLYIRTHKRLRANPAMDPVLISGPSLAYRPFANNTWWTDWLDAIAGNDTIPEQYSYHLEGETDDPTNDLQNTNASLAALLQEYDLPDRQININEYANFDEEIPAGAAFWILRLERYDAIGLRGNWLSGCQLHDFFGSLLAKPGAKNGAEDGSAECSAGRYYPNGEYQVYQYYTLNMTSHRVGTTRSGDRILDVYSTVDKHTVRTLAGVRLQECTWYITIDNLHSVGLPKSGNLAIQTWGFIDRGNWGEVDAPTDRGIAHHQYTGNSVTFAVWNQRVLTFGLYPRLV